MIKYYSIPASVAFFSSFLSLRRSKKFEILLPRATPPHNSELPAEITPAVIAPAAAPAPILDGKRNDALFSKLNNYFGN